MATSHDDTVYQSLYESDMNSKSARQGGIGRSPSDISHLKAPPAVRRRESNRQNIKQRLSNIISWYVPDNSEEEKVMLQIPEENDDIESGSNEPDNTPFIVKNLFNLESLKEMKDASILSICFNGGLFYVCVAGASTIYSFSLKNSQNSLKQTPVRLGRTELYPENILFHEEDLFVSGYFLKQDIKMYVLAKFRDGVVVSRTKPYPYPYFKHFAFDNDGSILVCSPQTSEDQTAAKVFKLAADFTSKSYFIKLGNPRVVYRPESVASHVAGDRGWISVRVESNGNKENLNSDKKQRRLISFTCCKPESILKPVETKEWLKVESWNFEMITPGLIMGFDSRLLIIDDEVGNLHYLDWNTENKPVIKPISKPGACKFIGMTKSKDSAFLFSEKSIFEFHFKESRILAENQYAII